MDVRPDIAPFDVRAALDLQRELGVSFPVAQILTRRGLGDAAAARTWLAADVAPDASAFAGIGVAVATVLRHVRAGTRITIHGDYDVDGVCSTAILVRTLRRLGADVDWYLPGRAEDGYGLRPATVERLAARGTRLLVTVDCGITAVEEVAQAVAAGMEVIVTDHHSPRADGRLPDAPIVHPAVCGYPCPELCAGAVSYKLAGALFAAAGQDAARADDELDLVALATVADLVPLVGENRRLVRAGLAALKRTTRPGLRALMRVAKADPGSLDATAIGFRLAPRLNAAGRMLRADAALELLLTEDDARATDVADELDRLNAERRHTETRILFSAEAQVAAASADGVPAAFVLAGEEWHPGVIGIVASRIAERHHRPVVVVALDGEEGTGSGRSIPGFDLLAALDASAAHLQRHGGHRAAAGATLAATDVDAFRAAFVAHAEATLTPEMLVPRERIDAVVSGDELGLELADELLALAPFGMGNPTPNLLVPGAQLVDARPMGEGKHVRFTVKAGGVQARAVAFGMPALPPGSEAGVEATFRLERNEWQGSVEPRLVLRRILTPPAGAEEATGAPPAPAATVVGAVDAGWDALVRAAAAAEVTTLPPVQAGADPWPAAAAAGGRPGADRRHHGVAGTLGALRASGDTVLVAVADAAVRAPALAPLAGHVVAWDALEADPALARSFGHIVVLDPPPHPALLAAVTAACPDTMAHLAWGAEELGFSLHVHAARHTLREPLAAVYRALRDGTAAPAALRGDRERPRDPVLAGRLLRVLAEAGLATVDAATLGAVLLPVDGRVDLERSATYRACTDRLRQGERWLSSARQRAA
ncbi:single-stranded-DNA-specific exonuclease RecJ [Paraconexibacter antarcticus]|uniref:Single-stranded-DNA-specific exonuclease RecJ n=1 Tax=Paraconexibacter antarcticus TaxID=2949664 RepID=A0ABY5DPS0_9ACTN|nr:single-stranded-DNA-specific exonuclease RecJ [Paraconexibacter antarcticus]UTI62715.1 single-stranded-DNA-specific exonuclease RecJ [Paraconexibacter antarcticus]